MDIKKISRTIRGGGKAKKGDTAQLAARLAPLEELDKRSAAQQLGAPKVTAKSDEALGAIVVDNDDMDIPRDMLQEGGERTILGVEPVVLAILIFMLVFIGFIAWQVSQMPAK